MWAQSGLVTDGERAGLALDTDIGAAVSLANTESYLKPTGLRLEMIFHLGHTTGTETTRGMALGFWGDALGGLPNFHTGFCGVSVDGNGSAKLNLLPMDGDPSADEILAHIGSWDQNIYNTLAYSVNTLSGNLYDLTTIILDGVTYSFATNITAFSDAQTDYALFPQRTRLVLM